MTAKSTQNAAQSKPATSGAKAPVKTFRLGRIKAAVWENESDERRFYNVTFARTYRDEQQNYHDTESFGRDDLPLVAKVADQAHTYIFERLAKSRVEDSERFKHRSCGRPASGRPLFVSPFRNGRLHGDSGAQARQPDDSDGCLCESDPSAEFREESEPLPKGRWLRRFFQRRIAAASPGIFPPHEPGQIRCLRRDVGFSRTGGMRSSAARLNCSLSLRRSRFRSEQSRALWMPYCSTCAGGRAGGASAFTRPRLKVLLAGCAPPCAAVPAGGIPPGGPN